MLKIKDYLILKDIENYLENKRDEEIRDNNAFSNKPLNEIEKLLVNLRKVIDKLEKEE